MPSEPAPLLNQLSRHGDGLATIIGRAEKIADLNRQMQQWSDTPWAASVRVVNIRDDTIVLFADNASAVVPLRYRKNELLAIFRQRLGLCVNKLDIKVRPALRAQV
ncbi:MAG: DciA family protein [Panacagrimonas sp.]